MLLMQKKIMYSNKLKNIPGPRLVISMELYRAFTRESRGAQDVLACNPAFSHPFSLLSGL